MNVSVTEAKNKLTQLIQAAEKGERVTICRHGKPVVDLVRTDPDQQRARKFGTMKGLVIDPDWARPQNDIEAWLRGDA